MKYNIYQHVRVKIIEEKIHSKLTKCNALGKKESDYFEMRPKLGQSSKVVDNLIKIHQHVFKHKKNVSFFFAKIEILILERCNKYANKVRAKKAQM